MDASAHYITQLNKKISDAENLASDLEKKTAEARCLRESLCAEYARLESLESQLQSKPEEEQEDFALHMIEIVDRESEATSRYLDYHSQLHHYYEQIASLGALKRVKGY